MASYAYVVTDVLGDEVIAELPLRNVTFESVVSGAGKLTAALRMPTVTRTIQPADRTYGTGLYGDGNYGRYTVENPENALARIYRGALDPVRCAIHVLRDGIPVWGGPVWSNGYTMNNREVRVEAAEWYSFLKKRFVLDDQDYVTADLHDIARALLTYTQGEGDLGIVLDTNDSGETLTISYAAHQVTQVAKAIEQLGATLNGFEFAIDITLNGTQLVRTLNLSHPTRGRGIDDSELVFEYGRNIINWTEQLDGTEMAGRVIGIGSGQGDATLLSIMEPSVPLTGYPLVEATASFKDVTDQDQLDLLTQAEADRRRLPVRTVAAEVLPDLPPLGSYRTGDEARFIIEPEQDPWNVDGIDETNRILGIRVTVDDDGGQDRVALTLVNRPITDATVEANTDNRLRALEATA